MSTRPSRLLIALAVLVASLTVLLAVEAQSETCNVSNCQMCVLNNAGVCHQCKSGYDERNGQCWKNTDCYVMGCIRCKSGSGEQCESCQAGYELRDTKCYRSANSASVSGSTLTAVAAAAAAMYAALH